MTSSRDSHEELAGNVRRLFDRLREDDAAPEGARERILGRLLHETAPPQASPKRSRRRWVGIAAALLVAVGLWTSDLRAPEALRGLDNGRGASLAIHILAAGPGRGVVQAATWETEEAVHIHAERQMSNDHIESAWVEESDSGCEVGLRLTTEGARKMAELTRNNIGERLALLVDNRVVMSPTIRSPISEGPVRLTGDFSDGRCGELAHVLSPAR